MNKTWVGKYVLTTYLRVEDQKSFWVSLITTIWPHSIVLRIKWNTSYQFFFPLPFVLRSKWKYIYYIYKETMSFPASFFFFKQIHFTGLNTKFLKINYVHSCGDHTLLCSNAKINCVFRPERTKHKNERLKKY